MVRKILFLLAITSFFGCEKENYYRPDIDAVSMYWDHEVFGKEGRRFRFELSGTQQFRNFYELNFGYSIQNNVITVTLDNVTDKGPAQVFPTGNGLDSLDNPRGNFWIPEKLLPIGRYKFVLKLSHQTVEAEMLVDKDSVNLNIPSNSILSSGVTTVFPIPKNILFGGIIYKEGTGNTSADKFFNDLKTLGLTQTSLPDYAYRNLKVDVNGVIPMSTWPPDNVDVGILYTLNKSFLDVFEIAKSNFYENNIEIALFSSNGDEAHLYKSSGITLVIQGQLISGI